MKLTISIIALAVATSSAAFAKNGDSEAAKGNSEAAKGMAAAAPTGLFDYPGASVARTLKGDSKGGWGNVGSGLLPTGVVAKPKR